MKTAWKYWGRLEDKRAVFVTHDGEVAVEEDHRHLVEAKPAEKQEIYRTWPELIDKPPRVKDNFPGIKEDPIGVLRGRIVALENGKETNEKTIENMKVYNDERERLIMDLMMDIENLKKQLAAADRTRKTLLETVRRRETMIDAMVEVERKRRDNLKE